MTIRDPDASAADIEKVAQAPEDDSGLPILGQAYQLIFDHSPALIAYVNRDHRFLLANQAYYEFLGLEHRQVVGRHVKDILNEQAYEQVREYMDLVVNEGRKVH